MTLNVFLSINGREQLMNNASTDLISFQPQETSYTAGMSSEQVLQYQDRMIAGI